MAFEGSDPVALRATAAALKATAATLTALATTYYAMAAAVAPTQPCGPLKAALYIKKAKSFSIAAAAASAAAAAAEAKAAKQDAASAAATFVPPTVNVPTPTLPNGGSGGGGLGGTGLNGSGLNGSGGGNGSGAWNGLGGLGGLGGSDGSSTVDSSLPEGYLDGLDGAAPGGSYAARQDLANAALGGAGIGAGLTGLGTSVPAHDNEDGEAGDPSGAGGRAKRDQPAPLDFANLAAGGLPVALGVAGTGIGLSVIEANRRKAKREENEAGEGEDGDDLEAVAETADRERPVTG